VDELASDRVTGLGRPGRRLWTVRLAVLAAVVIAAVILGPKLLSSGGKRLSDQPPAPSAAATTAVPPTPTPRAVAWPSALRWKVRGNLADDAAFVAAALTRARETQADAAKVLFAQSLPDGGRVAVVANPSDDSGGMFDGVSLLAVHVPAGADPQHGRVTFAGGIATEEDMAGWAGHGSDGRVYAVVFARPAPLQVEISSVIDYRPDGTASRQWRLLSGRDGSAVVALTGRVDPLVVARRRDLDGPSTYPLLLTVDGDRADNPDSDRGAGVRVAGLGGSYAGPQAQRVPALVGAAAGGLLDPKAADIRVVWSGTTYRGQKAAVVRLRRSDGVAFQTVVVQHPGGETYTQDLRHVAWRDADVVPWLLATGEFGTPLLLLNPSGPGRVVITPAYGEPKLTVRIGKGGVANLGADQAVMSNRLLGATATVYDAAGRRVVRTTLAGPNDDPFLLAQ
jgi:hypothetical protein